MSTGYQIKEQDKNYFNNKAKLQTSLSFGMQMPGREFASETYRHGYQGEFAEKDEELLFNRRTPIKNKYKVRQTGYDFFELRLWDGRIGRWMTTDPYAQYHSPYLGMGNNPINSIDPDGGWDNMPWFENLLTGERKYFEPGSEPGWGWEYGFWTQADKDFVINSAGKEAWLEYKSWLTRENGYAISISNGAYIKKIVGGMYDIGYVKDSYGNSSNYLTIGIAIGYGKTIGAGYTYLGKNFNVKDFNKFAFGFNASIGQNIPISLEVLGDSYEVYESTHVGTKYIGGGLNVGTGKAWYGYFSYTFLIPISSPMPTYYNLNHGLIDNTHVNLGPVITLPK